MRNYSNYSNYGSSAAPDGQAALARLQHQLSDNVNCATASTPEGKATICAIEDMIAALKDRMQAKPPVLAADASATRDASTVTASTALPRIGPVSGGVIDLYA